MRSLRYPVYVLLALIALAGLGQGWLASGASGSVEVDLRLIAISPDTYKGREVVTRGVVREYAGAAGRSYVLEHDLGPDFGQVLIEGPSIVPLVNHRVRVTGRVSFADDRGASIKPASVNDLGPAPR